MAGKTVAGRPKTGMGDDYGIVQPKYNLGNPNAVKYDEYGDPYTELLAGGQPNTQRNRIATGLQYVGEDGKIYNTPDPESVAENSKWYNKPLNDYISDMGTFGPMRRFGAAADSGDFGDMAHAALNPGATPIANKVFGRVPGAVDAPDPFHVGPKPDPVDPMRPHAAPGSVSPIGGVPDFGGGGAGAGGPVAAGDLPQKLLAERDAVKPYIPQQLNGGPADTTKGDAIRAQQLENINRLKETAAGRGPSVAEATLRSQLFDTDQNTMGLAASARGAESGGARRMAARQLSDNARKFGLDAALLKQKEMIDAGSQLGTQLDTTRTADNTVATSDADRSARAAEANQKAELDANRQRIDERSGLATAAVAGQQAETAARAQAEQAANFRAQLQFQYTQLSQAKTQAERDYWSKIITSTLAAAGTVLGAYYGGPAGAAVGGQVGSAAGGVVAGNSSEDMTD